MVNLLGSEEPHQEEERLRRLQALPGVHLHWYGKRGHRPGRKLGHLTIPLAGRSPAERQQECQHWLEEVLAIWPLPQPREAADAA
jgi:5-(carboxyamino)imidazole ribonucleotide synthase